MWLFTSLEKKAECWRQKEEKKAECLRQKEEKKAECLRQKKRIELYNNLKKYGVFNSKKELDDHFEWLMESKSNYIYLPYSWIQGLI